MVCEACEKKLSKITTPDPFTHGRSQQKGESIGRKVNENKLLSLTKSNKYVPYKANQFSRCRVCRSIVHQLGSHYCQNCAYQKGICAMCGKKLFLTKNYRQSVV